MRTLLLILTLVVGSSLFAAVDSPVQVLASGATLTLADGRTFQDWKIKRQTAASVFILSPKGVVAVDKRKLPEDLRANFPYDPVAVAKEAEELSISAAAGKEHEAEIAAQRKAEYDKRVAKAAPAFKEQKRQEKAKLEAVSQLGLKSKEELTREEAYAVMVLQDQIADSRDGLRITYLVMNNRKASLVMTNTTSGPVRFNWGQIKGHELGQKLISPASAYVTTPNSAPVDEQPFVIPAGGKRTYTVDFGSDSKLPVQAISWVEESWVSFVGNSRD